MGPATGLSCPHSLVADGPLEPDALLALEEALRVNLGLDRLELREAVRAPGVLLHGDALLFLLGVRKRYRTKLGVVGLEGPELVICDVVVLGASEDLVPGVGSPRFLGKSQAINVLCLFPRRPRYRLPRCTRLRTLLG